jgi:hypothetical protein
MSFFLKTVDCSCSLTALPFVYGGSVDDSAFYTFDIDSNNNIVAGGVSSDTGIVGSPPQNIVVFFDGSTAAV